MDLDLDPTSPMDEDSYPLLSIPSVDTDFVKWQGSQTSCVALDNLIIEASRPVPRRSPRHIKPLLQWDSSGPSTSSSGSSASPSATSTSTLTSSLPTRNRTRPRPPRHSHPNPSAPTFPSTSSRSSTPDLFKKDSTQFLDLLKGVSERVDEKANAKRRSIIAERGDGGAKRTKRLVAATGDGVGTKKGRGVKENQRVSAGMAMAAGNRIVEKAKGKEKETTAANTETSGQPVIAHRSLPNLTASTSASTMCVDYPPPRPGSSAAQSRMDVDASYSISMDVDNNPSDSPTALPPPIPPARRRTSMPPPAVPPSKIIPKPVSIPPSTPSTPAPPNPNPTQTQIPNPNPRIPPPPKYRPLIQQPPPPQSRPPKPQTRQNICPPPPPSPIPCPAPPQSQSNTRPPPLGMRRAHTLPLHSPFTPSQTLPARQKAFKVPLLSQTPPQAHPRPPPQPHPPHQPQSQPHTTHPFTRIPAKVEQPKLPTPSPSPQHQIPRVSRSPVQTQQNEEQRRSSSPDSSFGDMSFDMDALEETMRKYD